MLRDLGMSWRTAIVVVAVAVVAVLLTAAVVGVGRLIESVSSTTGPRTGSLAYAIDGDIVLAGSDGANPVRIAEASPDDETGCGSVTFWSEGPMWSPDGRHLAYRSERSPIDCDRPGASIIESVRVADATGDVVAEVPGVGWSIAWSPDSTRIATWLDVYPSTRIGVYGLDGARQAVVLLPSSLVDPFDGDRDPEWSADGDAIVVQARGETWELPVDGRPAQQLSDTQDRAARATQRSPDGTRVAYVDGGALVVDDVDGAQPRTVASGAWQRGAPAWSPTGDRIAFFGGGGTQMRVVDLASGDVTTVVGARGGDAVAFHGFSAEGDRILYSLSERSGRSTLWTVGADGSDRRMLVQGIDSGSSDWQTLASDASTPVGAP